MNTFDDSVSIITDRISALKGGQYVYQKHQQKNTQETFEVEEPEMKY